MFSKNVIVKYKIYSSTFRNFKNKGPSLVTFRPFYNSLDRCEKSTNEETTKVNNNQNSDTTESRLRKLISNYDVSYVRNKLSKLQPVNAHYRKIFYGGTGVAAVSANTEAFNASTAEMDLTIGTVNAVTNDNVPSASLDSPNELTVELIPEPPPIPEFDSLTDTVAQLNALGEPTFASLDLGGWTPVGIIQNCLEYIHVMGLPWWEAIAIGTVVVRFLMFPLVIMAQRNAAKMNNYLPQLQAIQLKMTEARQSGNELDAARYSQELMIFMKEKGLNPLKNMAVPLAQMPLFISFFIGLRKMANLPVDSLREGGLFWFTDLTVPDQYFILPIITSFTLWVTIELGTDSAKLNSQNLQIMKYVLRAMPLVILPFTVNFPGAILCYWVSSNFISLLQVGFLKIPKVRDYFNIEPLVTHNPKNLPIPSKGFVGGVKDSWTNIKITKELEERKRYDELQFQRAGRGPIVKTFKYDPTKQTKNSVTAKPR